LLDQNALGIVGVDVGLADPDVLEACLGERRETAL
jgi:hypothetical protein